MKPSEYKRFHKKFRADVMWNLILRHTRNKAPTKRSEPSDVRITANRLVKAPKIDPMVGLKSTLPPVEERFGSGHWPVNSIDSGNRPSCWLCRWKYSWEIRIEGSELPGRTLWRCELCIIPLCLGERNFFHEFHTAAEITVNANDMLELGDCDEPELDV
jgi:hypothetical protein